MVSSPQVSVVMPVYNAEPYLAEAMRSILVQTWEDFEFIIIDNGSTDASPETIRSFTDSRIRVITNPVNVAPPPAINQGLRLATGRYVARMDADDVALPGRLKKQWTYMETHPRCAAVGTQAVLIDHAGLKIYTPWCPTMIDAIRWRLLFTSPFVHSSMLMRREVVLGVDAYNEGLRHAADYDLWFRLLEKGCEITNLPDVLTKLRVHEQSDGMTARWSPELLEEMVDVSQAHIQELLHIKASRQQLLDLAKLLRRDESLAESGTAIELLRTLSRASGRRSRPYYGLTTLGIALSAQLPAVARVRLIVRGIAALVWPPRGPGSYKSLWSTWIAGGRLVERVRFERRSARA